jgi:hypothetical protein
MTTINLAGGMTLSRTLVAVPLLLLLTLTAAQEPGFYLGAIDQSCASRCTDLSLVASSGAEAVNSSEAIVAVLELLGEDVTALCNTDFRSSTNTGAPGGTSTRKRSSLCQNPGWSHA